MWQKTLRTNGPCLTGYEHLRNLTLSVCDVRCFQSLAASFCVWVLRQQNIFPSHLSSNCWLAIQFLYTIFTRLVCSWMVTYMLYIWQTSSANKSFGFCHFHVSFTYHIVGLSFEWDWHYKLWVGEWSIDWWIDWLDGWIYKYCLKLSVSANHHERNFALYSSIVI